MILCAEWLSPIDLSVDAFLEESGAVGGGAKFINKAGSILVELNFCGFFLGASFTTGFGVDGSLNCKVCKRLP